LCSNRPPSPTHFWTKPANLGGPAIVYVLEGSIFPLLRPFPFSPPYMTTAILGAPRIRSRGEHRTPRRVFNLEYPLDSPVAFETRSGRLPCTSLIRQAIPLVDGGSECLPVDLGPAHAS